MSTHKQTEREFLEIIVNKLRPHLTATDNYDGGGYIDFANDHRCSFAGLASDLQFMLKRAAS